MKPFAALLLLLSFAAARPARAQVPSSLLGTWRVERVLPTQRQGCWDEERARSLVGTTLVYAPHAIRWQGGEVPLQGIRAVVRTLSRQQFSAEYTVLLDDLGIRAPHATEVDLQHEDADVTGSTTEVPGDTILLASPTRIIVSACGVFYEALRSRS